VSFFWEYLNLWYMHSVVVFILSNRHAHSYNYVSKCYCSNVSLPYLQYQTENHTILVLISLASSNYFISIHVYTPEATLWDFYIVLRCLEVAYGLKLHINGARICQASVVNRIGSQILNFLYNLLQNCVKSNIALDTHVIKGLTYKE
jgi:hypothetical protein